MTAALQRARRIGPALDATLSSDFVACADTGRVSSFAEVIAGRSNSGHRP